MSEKQKEDACLTTALGYLLFALRKNKQNLNI